MLKDFKIGEQNPRLTLTSENNIHFLSGGNGSGKSRTLRGLYDASGQMGLSFKGERLSDTDITLNLEFDGMGIVYAYTRQNDKLIKESLYINHSLCLENKKGKVPNWDLKGAENLKKAKLSDNISSCLAYLFSNTSLDDNPTNQAFIKTAKFLDGIGILSLSAILTDVFGQGKMITETIKPHLSELNQLLDRCGFQDQVIEKNDALLFKNGDKMGYLFGTHPEWGLGGYIDGFNGGSLGMVYLTVLFAKVKNMEQSNGSLLLVDDWNSLLTSQSQAALLYWMKQSSLQFILSERI